jgi:ABC-type multidrug transport system ATPase subunit/pSer/pThr/pTyr-binding forkhead associated (FHA) protein
MRIILAEIHGEQKLTSREFKQTKIKIGRDQLRNNLAFDGPRWPMVSRLHAEISFADGHWYLIDVGSRHGTFLNGQAILAATEIQSGSVIQLGPEGPILSVELTNDLPVVPASPEVPFDGTLIDSQAAKQQAALRARTKQSSRVESPTSAPQSPLPQQQSAAINSPVPSVSPPLRSVAALICESGSPTQVGRQFVIVSETTLLGRDAAADISIDAAAPIISRRHAELRRQDDGGFAIVDLSTFNGTLVNDRRITQPTTLHIGDRIQLAPGGPVFRFIHPTNPQPEAKGPPPASLRSSEISKSPGALSAAAELGLNTIISRSGAARSVMSSANTSARLLFERKFDSRQTLTVGRGPENDIQLDGLLISKYHARFINSPQGVLIEDAGSTNGVYLNGGKVTGRPVVQSQDAVQIGPFVLKADRATGIAVFDNRSRTRIDAIAITETVRQRSGRGPRKLLDEISLAIDPNEFVGVLGPSGAGKSMLMRALNGMRPTTSGRVLINSLDLYQHVDLLKQSIGYVPQDDIIHSELTVYRTLYYVARLRLSRDVPVNEIDQIISEVLDVTGLADRRDVLVSELSGGQRKRVSIAVELLTKPSLIFLDEPTSGLDPATEERFMKLFRQIAESGHTVILTTHAMENVRLFDRVVLLLRGKLIFYGTPAEALEFVGATNFIDLYNQLEAPVASEVARLAPLPPKATKPQQRADEQRREEIADAVAENWRTQFMATEVYRHYIDAPLGLVQPDAQTSTPTHHRRGIVDAVRQWTTLVRRYAEVLASNKWNLLILFGQAPIIGLLTYFVVGRNDPRDFTYFILALVSIWFGTSVAARELIKEQPVFKRERMVNLGLFPYVASKLFVLSFIVGLQTTLLFSTLKILHFAGLLSLPGYLFGLPQLLVMALTGMVGIALGLLISALVKTSEVATSLVPLILIPQILFAGLVTVPTGTSRVLGAAMPATWSFDELKRLSSLDTLKEDGSDPGGPNQGRGLFQHIKDLNAENVSNTRNQVEAYSKRVSSEVSEQARRTKELSAASNNASSTSGPESADNRNIGVPPSIPDPQEINDNLSGYVSFKHPWGGLVRDPAILCAMLFALLLATIIALRARDVR